MDDEDRVTSLGFLIFAREYFKSYETIQKNFPKITEVMHVKYYLLCHCIELTLKSELKFNKYPAVKLKSPLFGHDLDKLTLELRKYNIEILPKYLALMTSINIYYKTKQFEYPLIGYKKLVSLKELDEFASLIMLRMEFKIKEKISTELLTKNN